MDNEAYVGRIPWKAGLTRIRNVQRSLIKAAEAGEVALAQFGLEEMKESILSGSLDVQPLAPATIAQKIREGFPTNPLIRTRDYLDSLVVVKTSKGMTVKPRPGSTTREGTPMVTLMAVHEFGNDRIPARPHIRPTIETLKKKAPKVLAKIYTRLIQEAGL